MIYIRTTSHRSRERLEFVLGHKPEYWYSLWHDGYYVQIEPKEWERIKPIVGVTKTRVVPSGRCHHVD